MCVVGEREFDWECIAIDNSFSRCIMVGIEVWVLRMKAIIRGGKRWGIEGICRA
jgi:hypothetical protein